MSIRPLEPSDLTLILGWRNQPRVRENMYTTHEITWEEHVAWFARLQTDPARMWFVYEHSCTPAGVIYFTDIQLAHSTAFWGFYASDQAPPGTGLAMEYDALTHAFEQMRLRKLCCEVLSFNKTVINLHARTGFVQEGLFKAHILHQDKAHDVVRLALFSDQWPAAREKLRGRISGLLGNT